MPIVMASAHTAMRPMTALSTALTSGFEVVHSTADFMAPGEEACLVGGGPRARAASRPHAARWWPFVLLVLALSVGAVASASSRVLSPS